MPFSKRYRDQQLDEKRRNIRSLINILKTILDDPSVGKSEEMIQHYISKIVFKDDLYNYSMTSNHPAMIEYHVINDTHLKLSHVVQEDYLGKITLPHSKYEYSKTCNGKLTIDKVMIILDIANFYQDLLYSDHLYDTDLGGRDHDLLEKMLMSWI